MSVLIKAMTIKSLWFAALAVIVVGYAFLAGLHPITGDDLFFMLNDAKWLLQHHEVPWVDHFAAQGQPWIYPVGGSLLFYAVGLSFGFGVGSASFASAA